MEHRIIDISLLDPNEGQIDGLPSNPRKWGSDELERLCRSIEETPELLEARGIIVAPHAGRYIVLGGNMRLAALRELGYAEAPCIVLPESTPAEKLREIVIKDNGSFGEWDTAMLESEWSDLPLDDWGVCAEWDEETSGGSDSVSEDDFDEETDEVPSRAALGEIWELGVHRLMCGDSTDTQTLEALMGGVLADMYLTDPPYNVNYTGKTKDAMKIRNDSQDDDSFRAFLTDCFLAADKVLRPGASFYIWHADSEGFNFRYAVKACGWMLKQCLIWNKNSMVLGRQDYQWKHEPCLYGWKPGASHHWYAGRNETTVLDYDRPQRNGEHPTMKPLEMFAKLIDNSSMEGDTVLDTFGGSGTTLIACEQLGRKCRMMELDPHYCDVIMARWEKLTGRKAVKIS